MKRIKVIDLLFKIANDELEDLTLVKFREHDCLTIFHKKDKRFEFMKKGGWNDYFNVIDIATLNDEVEILDSILDKKEKEYLSSVIKPFRNEVKGIAKIEETSIEKQYISVRFYNRLDNFTLPYFKKNSMYKNMKLDKEYTIEELEL